VLAVRRPDDATKTELPCYFYKAKLPRKNMTWRDSSGQFDVEVGALSFAGNQVRSPEYYNRFLQGATLVPRCFWFVELRAGAAPNDKAPHLETSHEALAESKPEWRVQIRGQIETEFLYQTVLAKGLLPFSILRRELLFLPVRALSDGPVMTTSDGLLD
jgi:hypothetical protein